MNDDSFSDFIVDGFLNFEPEPLSTEKRRRSVEKPVFDDHGLFCHEEFHTPSPPNKCFKALRSTLEDAVPRMKAVHEFIDAQSDPESRQAAIVASNLPLALQRMDFAELADDGEVDQENEFVLRIDDVHDWLRGLGFTGSTSILERKKLEEKLSTGAFLV